MRRRSPSATTRDTPSRGPRSESGHSAAGGNGLLFRECDLSMYATLIMPKLPNISMLIFPKRSFISLERSLAERKRGKFGRTYIP